MLFSRLGQAEDRLLTRKLQPSTKVEDTLDAVKSNALETGEYSKICSGYRDRGVL
jgi:hypothetical protein